ncbi:MAG: metal-dependent hydrolase [Acidobacteria bacterium]|nr:metal-dependent hydrolase [Acidobacteriota bacterium]
MDTLTQMTLGAGVGELILGRKVGNKALLWGAVAGLIPDLDVLAGVFMSPVDRFVFHRTVSHSILFCVVLAPLLGWLLARLHAKDKVPWLPWSRLVFWGLFTHILLDCFTGYGTQVFWPFLDHRVEWNTIFVVDPLYTLPFLGCLLVLVFLNRTSRTRRILAWTGIGLSTAYLALTVVNKLHMESVFQEALVSQNLAHRRLMTQPSPLNNLLWRGVAETHNGYWIGYYSLLDDDRRIRFRFVPRLDRLIDDLRRDPDLVKLLHKCDGYYCLTREDGALVFNDLRFGRFQEWDDGAGGYIFAFVIETDSAPLSLTRRRPDFPVSGDLLKQFVARVFGNKEL